MAWRICSATGSQVRRRLNSTILKGSTKSVSVIESCTEQPCANAGIFRSCARVTYGNTLYQIIPLRIPSMGTPSKWRKSIDANAAGILQIYSHKPSDNASRAMCVLAAQASTGKGGGEAKIGS